MNARTIELIGYIEFAAPDPGAEELEFNITCGDKEHKLKLDRTKELGSIIIKSGKKYKVTCTDETGVRRVCGIEEMWDPDEPKDDGGGGFPDLDVMMKEIDYKIFCLECQERSNDMPIIEARIRGCVRNVRGVKEGLSFSLRQDGRLYKCLIVESMNSRINRSEISAGDEYVLHVFMIGDTTYAYDITWRDKTPVPKPAVPPKSVAPPEPEPDEEPECGPFTFIPKLPFENSAFNGGKPDRGLADLNKRQRAEIESITQQCDKYEVTRPENNSSAFTAEEELKQKFRLCREHYPPDVQEIIERTINDRDLKLSQRKEILKLLINTSWSRKLELDTRREHLMDAANKTHYGQEYLKNALIKILYAYEKRCGKKGENILLIGPPGVGKTSLVQSIARAAGMPFEKISLNGVDTPLFLSGTPRLYDNAIFGKVLRTVQKIGNRGIILFDEADKMPNCSGRDGNPYTAFNDLLDRGEKFYDKFLEAGIDLGDMIFVLTANDIAAMPPDILSRVPNRIYVPDYTEEEKLHIARDFVIPREMAKYDWQGRNVTWEPEAIEDIGVRFTLANGVREIEGNVSGAVKSVLLHMTENGLGDFTVTRENAAELVDIPPCARERVVHDIGGLKHKYMSFKYDYPEDTRRHVSALFTKYDVCRDDREREMLLKRLDPIINILPAHGERFDVSRVRRCMDESHYGMEQVKEQIECVVAGINARGTNRAACLLLDGPCGVGKTSIAKSIARGMGRKFAKVSLGGVSDPQHIKGFERTWKDAECGRIVEELARCGTDAVVMLLDEVDKMSVQNGKSPYGALNDLLDSSGMFTDSFLGVPLDLSNVLFIATSNDRNKIPFDILDRMTCIEVPSYSEQEKLRIARDCVLPRKLCEYRAASRITFDAHMLRYMVRNYCLSFGVRDIESAVDRVIRRALKEKTNGDGKCRVTAELIGRALGARPIPRGNMVSDERMRPGVVRALAVSGSTGSTFAVQVTENTCGEHDEITGLPGKSILDSVKIAKLLVSKKLGRAIEPMHIHFAEGGIEKDGPSAGITLFSAIYSYCTDRAVDRRVAFTGEIDVLGDVWAIGGVELKLRAAECQGCTHVFIPLENYTQLKETGELEKYDCNIVPVSSVDDIIKELFNGQTLQSA